MAAPTDTQRFDSHDEPPLTKIHGPPDIMSTWEIVKFVLTPIASLKLTVALFAASIFLIFAGTLAQVDKDIWQVVDEYFRAWRADIDLQVFFPPSFFPSKPHVPGFIPFPGGWTIGTLMFFNLLCAHLVRFKIQSSGQRLLAGLVMILVGSVLTWLVIASGSNMGGVYEAWLSWSAVWNILLGSLLASFGGLVWYGVSTPPEKKVERWTSLSVAAALGAVGLWLLSLGESPLDPSGTRILWQLLKGCFAGGVLLLGCVMAFNKRAGVVLLHGAIGLMMMNELVVHKYHVEAQMHLAEGETVNYVKDIRTVELAFAHPEDGKETVTVIPLRYLAQEGSVIKHPLLPCDVKVVKFFTNSNIRPIQDGDDKTLADAGAGQRFAAVAAKPGAGTDMGGKVDVASAYLQFLKKGTTDVISKRLVSIFFSMQNLPDHLTFDGKTYEVSLRFKQIYKPYSMTLIDVRQDNYLGTNTPRNYSSDLQLVDKSRNVDRKVKIWMNNPLRFAGETFYQSNFHRDPQTGIETTGLQVVSNTGWMIPYVSCMLVWIGMLAHFSITLLRFLNRQVTQSKTATVPVEVVSKPSIKTKPNIKREPALDSLSEEPKSLLKEWGVAVGIVAFIALWLLSKASMPKTDDNQMAIYKFGQLPLVFEGRVKPFDTLARTTLRVLSNKETFLDAKGDKQPAIIWLLDMMSESEISEEHRIFYIHHPEVIDVLDLERRKSHLYSVGELRPKAEIFNKEVEQARKLDVSDLSTYQRQILDLDRRIRRYTLIQASFRNFEFPAFPTEEEFKNNRQGVENKTALIQEMLFRARQHIGMLEGMEPPLAVPVTSKKDSTWLPYSQAWVDDYMGQIEAQVNNTSFKENVPTLFMHSLLRSYAEGDRQKFNRDVAGYRAMLSANPPQDLDIKKTEFEAFFNQFSPFYHASVLYVMAFILTAFSWLGFNKTLNRSAMLLILFTLAVHSYALISRIYISGRPPVTNLYSSAVFIGWGAVLLGLIFEGVFGRSIGNVIASIAGFSTLLIAHFLSGDGDTFVVLQAVLDTQFWLATHVVCITLGYTTTFVAGLLGLIYVFAGVCTPAMKDKQFGQEMGRMIYGSICFAIFFSFVGTVLGGLWADDSWGRFWGWDPKENGALMIVLWNALVLHAKWDGMVKVRGLALLSIGGNIITAWSWFGVNELGVGLHSYGFTDGVLLALGLFIASQLAIIGMGLIPQSSWISFRPTEEAKA